MADNKGISPLADVLKPREGRHLGDLCGWGLHGAQERTKVLELAEQLGLKDDFVFPRIGANSAYRRAVNKAVRGGKADERQYAAVLVEDTPTKIVHAIVRREIVDTAGGELSPKDAAFHTDVRVGFDKDGYKDEKDPETLLRLEDEEHQVSKRIKSIYEELAVVFLPQDIRVAFQRAFEKWGAMRLLEHGGLWWVPEPAAEKVRAWKEFMLALSNTTVIIPVFDTDETIQSLREQSKLNLESQLADLLEQLESFTGQSTTRLSTLERRVERFDELRDKIELHARVLGHKQEELLSKLNEASKGLVQSLAAIKQ
jgi:hypothetical protein